MSQHRSIRGSFTSKVKEAIHSVFGANELPSINTQATPSQIQKWKNTSGLKRCYQNLFKKINNNELTTFMSKIIEKLRSEKRSPLKIQITYVISISETYLSPENQSIQINENIVKPKIIKNLVSFNFNLE